MSTERNAHENDPDPAAWPPAWKIWANPIFRRYCRSRLRARGLGVWMLLTLLISGFIFFFARWVSLYEAGMDVVDAERTPLIPLLIFQGIVLFLLGTGQVAGGMTAEADEGVIDYQRLAPMSPLAKVLGYIFGLPVREYLLVAITLPFTLWSCWRGEVPAGIALQLYAVFFTSAILYHLTGLVAGTVVKNRRWAFLVSMGVVFLLYTVIPRLSDFGLVYFEYLTIYPVATESVPYMVERTTGAGMISLQNLLPSANFFDLGLPQVVFTFVSQAALILTMIMILWRRWRRAESHLLGKAWATGLFAWIQLVLLGNALPLVQDGYLFPSKGLDRWTGRFNVGDWYPRQQEAIGMTFVFGVVSLAFLWILTLMITPNADGRLRGWRRARKLGQKRLSPLSDPATSFPSVFLMVLMGTAGWFTFARSVIESHWFPGWGLQPEALGAFFITMLTGGLGFHAILEGKGGRAAGLAAILIGVVPIMAGILTTLVTDRSAASVWLYAVSPAAAPAFAAAVAAPLADMPTDLYRAVPRAFWFWQGLGALLLIQLLFNLRRSLRATAIRAANEAPGGQGGGGDATAQVPPPVPAIPDPAAAAASGGEGG